MAMKIHGSLDDLIKSMGVAKEDRPDSDPIDDSALMALAVKTCCSAILNRGLPLEMAMATIIGGVAMLLADELHAAGADDKQAQGLHKSITGVFAEALAHSWEMKKARGN